jgi:hypothetical protein
VVELRELAAEVEEAKLTHPLEPLVAYNPSKREEADRP